MDLITHLSSTQFDIKIIKGLGDEPDTKVYQQRETNEKDIINKLNEIIDVVNELIRERKWINNV